MSSEQFTAANGPTVCGEWVLEFPLQTIHTGIIHMIFYMQSMRDEK